MGHLWGEVNTIERFSNRKGRYIQIIGICQQLLKSYDTKGRKGLLDEIQPIQDLQELLAKNLPILEEIIKLAEEQKDNK